MIVHVYYCYHDDYVAFVVVTRPIMDILQLVVDYNIFVCDLVTR